MFDIKNTLMTKMTAMLLCIVMLVGLIPMGVFSAFAADNAKMGTLSCLTENGKVTNATGDEATAVFSGLTLNWFLADPAIGRTQDGWWVGVKMEAPADMLKAEDFENVTYQRCVSADNDTWTDAMSFWNAQDSDKSVESTVRYLTMWGIVNEQYLNDAIVDNKTINFAWRFDWDGNGKYEQKAMLKIDPADIKLYKDGSQVYPATKGMGTVSPISEGLALDTEACGNVVKVKYDAATVLEWAKADPDITRFNDGWWAGVKVTTSDESGVEADLEKVTYQSKDKSGWGEVKYFKNSAENASAGYFVNLWGLLNETYLKEAAKDGKNLKHTWRFDWNGDGVYEQIVVIETEPSKITLVDEEGNQVYPEMGIVETITDGFTVTGSGTHKAVASADELTLDWSDKGESAGWWAGVQITAPEGVKISETEDVYYQSKVGDDWETKSFYENQTSAKNGTMELWTVLDRTMLADAIKNNKTITAQWQFDWNKDGKFEQVVIMEIAPSEDIVLNRLERTDFGFTETATDKQVWIGYNDGKYEVEAKSDKAPGIVTYAIDESKSEPGAATIDNNGVVTMNKTGKVTVVASIDEDDVYEGATKEFTFEIVKKYDFDFEISEPEAVTFGKNDNKFTNAAVLFKNSDSIKYKVIEGDAAEIEDETKPVLTIVKAGTVVVQATRKGDEWYGDATTEYTLVINKAENTAEFDKSVPDGITYSPTDTFGPYEIVDDKIDYSKTEEKISYKITDGEGTVATVDKVTGEITTVKSGKFTLKVTIPSDYCYEAKTLEKEITVNKADRQGFKFEKTGPFTVTYNENGNKFKNTAFIGVLGSTDDEFAAINETVKYKITEGTAAIIENEKSPVVKIKVAGEVTVTAVIPEDDCYNECIVAYKLTINKVDQAFTFAEGYEIVRNYGITEFYNEPVPATVDEAADGKGYGSGDYEVTVNKNNIGATIGEDRKTVVFGDSEGKAGTVTVTVTKTGDECYNEATASYTITIVYDKDFADVTVDKDVNKNGWYNGDIKIYPENDKYLISYNNNLSTADWNDYVVCSKEGTEAPVVYLKNTETGNISDAIVLEDYKMDKTAPKVLGVEFDKELLKTNKDNTYDVAADSVKVTLKAQDSGSGIDYIGYRTAGTNGEFIELDKKINGTTAETTLNIKAQHRDAIEFKVVDMAGNDVLYNDGKTIVLDSISPQITLGYEFSDGAHHKTANGVLYSNDALKVYIYLTADNLDLTDAFPVIKLGNETVKNLEWNKQENSNGYQAVLPIDADGDYVLSATFRDRLGRNTNFTKLIRIDRVAPVIPKVEKNENGDVITDYEIKPGEAVTHNNIDRKYYNTAQNISFTIIDHNFAAENVKLIITAKDYNGASVDEFPVAKYADYVKNPENWEHEGDKHTLKADGFIFDIDANYTLSLEVTDFAGNTSVSGNPLLFTVDTEPPTSPKITYSKSVWHEIIEDISFGFFKAPVKVTVESEDEISGLYEIKYSYVGTQGEYVIKEVKVEGKDQTNDSFSFTIDEEFKGTVSATAIDYSGNESYTQTVGADENNEIDEIVVDNIAPKRKVELTSADLVADASTLEDIKNYDFTAENTNAILYYKDKVTVTFTVEEANFFEDDVKVTVNDKLNNPTDWKYDEESKKWVGTITLDTEGDYVVRMNYTDKSGNVMKEYESEKIVIDHTDPEIGVSYDVYDYVSEHDGRQYFDKNRTATITIKEHNFRADDVVVTVLAKNVEGENITSTLTFDESGAVKEYAAAGVDRGNWSAYTDASWRRFDDEYKLTLNFTEDANYTLDVVYNDLATRSAADLKKQLFTVDKVDPRCVKVDYSTNVFEDILNDITFGFYNAQMTVTITAEDEISGVDRFVYSYLKSANVSSVNAELVNQELSFDKAKKTASVQFKVPKLALREDNQFNGIIEFTAFDRSGNTSDKFTDESTVIVVDNIKPTNNVQIDPGKSANGVDYYDGPFSVNVTINEANFYEEDFEIVVTRDGANYPVDYKWKEDSLDAHSTRFPLTDDGDYIITVRGRDKSGNVMDTYVSNQRTIDTNAPVITVSDVKHQSANNGETISFTVSATDVNISEFRPELTAIVKKEIGKNKYDFVSVPISLGNSISTTENGKNVLTYRIENLEIDGFYSLVCTALDYAGNSVNVITNNSAEGANVELDTFDFSVNREGSVFWLETEHNDKYSGDKYVDQLNGAYANDKVTIKLHELNVDKVDISKEKKTVFTLNDGSESADITLKNGKNYTKNAVQSDGCWYETLYTLNNDNFDHDGVYSLNVITYDKADNSNINTSFEESTISFTVDRTNPVISANVKSDQRVNDTKFWVEFEVNETNLATDTIDVVLKNNDGKTVDTEVTALGNNEYKFLVESGYNYSFKIVAKDLAGNESEIYNVEHFTVSTNILVLWYANTPLFWGSIGGTVLLAGLIIVLIVLKKKKN